jgi:hypothetical protein
VQARIATGAVLAGFRIESPLGEGAMASVFVAEDTRRGGSDGAPPPTLQAPL